MRFQGGGTRAALACVALAGLGVAVVPAGSQETAAPAKPAAAAPANPARDLTASKCFQCHTDAMWRDQRLDARAWEATLYRMLARGAVWSDVEIKSMTSYLAADFGPNAPKSPPVAR